MSDKETAAAPSPPPETRAAGVTEEEIAQLRTDLATHIAATETTENRIIDAEFLATELRQVLQDIADGFGPNHMSMFCRNKAIAALALPHNPAATSEGGE